MMNARQHDPADLEPMDLEREEPTDEIVSNNGGG